MRKPEEIKKGLNQCRTIPKCADCPYIGIVVKCDQALHADALAYIEELERRSEGEHERTKADA